MPGGSTGGFAAKGRFFRSAALSSGALGASAQLAWDTTSAKVEVVGASLVAGNVAVGVAGTAYFRWTIQANGIALLNGLRVVTTRSPGTARELVVDDKTLRGVATLGAFSLDGRAEFDVDVDDTIRLDFQPLGVTVALALTTGDAFTWCGVSVG